jgi:hypothetical protein
MSRYMDCHLDGCSALYGGYWEGHETEIHIHGLTVCINNDGNDGIFAINQNSDI